MMACKNTYINQHILVGKISFFLYNALEKEAKQNPEFSDIPVV